MKRFKEFYEGLFRFVQAKGYAEVLLSSVLTATFE